ncbi:hypothetical protein V5P93_003531 [Actinokineospora auranticolor]|uniref:Uncharacterized protein n=1 Tax=Actinokineospora auranticolor TaxID=155976 RepID=A0A2S6GPV0_9PSEU|nr:hypothetical protein [Actinokineospora auranticolor]PPK67193.1 hypothetical protein CLV40_108191 [Actinokineospora auranticolor]
MSPITAFHVITWAAIVLLFLGLGAVLREVRLLRAAVARDPAGYTATRPDLVLGPRFAGRVVLAADSGCPLCVAVARELRDGVLLTHESPEAWDTALQVVRDREAWRGVAHLSPPVLMLVDGTGRVSRMALPVRETQVAEILAEWGVRDGVDARSDS